MSLIFILYIFFHQVFSYINYFLFSGLTPDRIRSKNIFCSGKTFVGVKNSINSLIFFIHKIPLWTNLYTHYNKCKRFCPVITKRIFAENLMEGTLRRAILMLFEWLINQILS